MNTMSNIILIYHPTMPKITLETFRSYYENNPKSTGKAAAEYFGVSEATICYRKSKMHNALNYIPDPKTTRMELPEEDPNETAQVDTPYFQKEIKEIKELQERVKPKSAEEIYKQILLDHMKVIQESLKNIEDELSQTIPIDTDVRVFVEKTKPRDIDDIYTDCTALIENFVSGYRTSDMMKIPLQHFVDYISKRAGWDE